MHKLLLNLGWRAWTVLGTRQYAWMWLATLGALRAIMRDRNLRELDRRMGRRLRIRCGAHRFWIDCGETDRLVPEDSFTFGLVRELYIRDCYLHLHRAALPTVKRVMDLGGNRGLFTILASTFADEVLYVECNPAYRPAVSYNLALNGVRGVVIRQAFVGAGGVLGEAHDDHVSVDALLDEIGWNEVDLVKMDIEGSEFALFRDPAWLCRVRRVAMEVHHAHGECRKLLETFSDHGFETQMCRTTLRPTSRIAEANFVHAWRTSTRQ